MVPPKVLQALLRLGCLGLGVKGANLLEVGVWIILVIQPPLFTDSFQRYLYHCHSSLDNKGNATLLRAVVKHSEALGIPIKPLPFIFITKPYAADTAIRER